MWKLTVVADARPLIVFAVASTCFKSMTVESRAPTVTVVPIDTSSRSNVNVAAVDAVLVTTMLLTTVVVDDGTVYRVVLDVAAAPRKRALVAVAISYYFLLECAHKK
jgi:IMP cyclohydrolase